MHAGVYSALSMVTFVVVLWRMYTMLKVVPGNPRKGSSFFLTVILWTVYPLVFYSSQFGLITFKQSEICLLFVNFFAKVNSLWANICTIKMCVCAWRVGCPIGTPK